MTFRYRGTAEDSVPALHDVNLRIPRGSRVALVGPVGSGKSTLVNLLTRLYPAPEGTIFIGGRDLTTIPVGQLRRSIGYVPQEAFLFSRSVRDNVLEICRRCRRVSKPSSASAASPSPAGSASVRRWLAPWFPDRAS